MEVGDAIIWCSNYEVGPIRKGVVSKAAPNFVWVDGNHKCDDSIYKDFCWPAAAEEELKAIIEHCTRLKKQFDESMALVYQLRNKYSEHKSDG